jgi:hypothetical protein
VHQMRPQIIAAIAALALTGCASPMTRKYAGHPVADVVRDLGSPANIFDGKDGLRRFEWSTSDVVVSSAPEGGYSEQHWNENWALDEGAPGARYCTLTILARWDTTARRWIVTRSVGPLQPNRGSCGMR